MLLGLNATAGSGGTQTVWQAAAPRPAIGIGQHALCLATVLRHAGLPPHHAPPRAAGKGGRGCGERQAGIGAVPADRRVTGRLGQEHLSRTAATAASRSLASRGRMFASRHCCASADRFVGAGVVHGRPPGFDRGTSRRGNVIERCFNRLKGSRGIATGYRKDRHFLRSDGPARSISALGKIRLKTDPGPLQPAVGGWGLDLSGIAIGLAERVLLVTAHRGLRRTPRRRRTVPGWM